MGKLRFPAPTFFLALLLLYLNLTLSFSLLFSFLASPFLPFPTILFYLFFSPLAISWPWILSIQQKHEDPLIRQD